MSKTLDDEICSLLKTVAEHFDKEDRATRERQIRHWRRLKLYWNNFSQVYWSEVAQDYRVYNRDSNSQDTDQDYYDKPINVFKAFLETIIAALSIQIPAVSCVPDDAENPLDISTAKAGDKISELVYKHNDVMFLWLHALYIYCTEGLIACYSYPKADKEYGTYDKPKFKDEEVDSYVCSQCGARIPDEMMESEESDEYDPHSDENDKDSQNTCIECGSPIKSDLQKTKLKIPRLVGTTKEPKTRICLEVYGGLYVKIANYAKKQVDTPYLIFSYETHYANALECYPKLRDKIPHGGWSSIGVNDPYEQYGRLNTQYRGEFPEENVTVKNCWLRCAAFNVLPEESYKKLKKHFPNGAKFVMVNDVPVDYEDENLDDHWTLTENPMSDFLNHDPLGELLTNVQDIVNDLISLTLQTIEHGISQTWADPAVVNFNAQRQIEAMPGTITPTKPVSGSRNVGEAFYTSKSASLSPEVFNFYKIIQELGQFVSGALPSIFGGNAGAGSSRTASEYAMSKGMALQRLQTPWRMMTIWWKTIFGKVIPMYMKNMVEDERVVEKNDAGKFINVFIRKAEMDGKIGSIELEPDEKLPVSDEQQADIIMQLFQLNNAEISAALMDPENLPFISKVVKIPEFHLPGEEDREKQYEEIDELINSTPIPPNPESIQMYQQAVQAQQQNPNHNTPPPQQPQEQPSVEIDPDVDNHQIEASICKSWLISSAGRLAKKENPNGYKNVLLHMKAHLAIVTQQMQAQQLHDDQIALASGKPGQKTSDEPSTSVKTGQAPTEKPKTSEKVSGERNAKAPVQ
jgi:DNA-directed RNA polymerase subunit RPC12/RpoP